MKMLVLNDSVKYIYYVSCVPREFRPLLILLVSKARIFQDSGLSTVYNIYILLYDTFKKMQLVVVLVVITTQLSQFLQYA